MIYSVSGLPRSGTCWSTAFFGMNPRCFSVHEAATGDVNWKEMLRSKLLDYSHVVDCNTYMIFTDFWYLKRIWIDRDPNQCLKSSEAVFGPVDRKFWDECVERSIEYKKRCSLIIPFDEIFTVSGMRTMWEHVFEDVEFDEDKALILAGMNIQRNKAKEIFTYDNCKHIL